MKFSVFTICSLLLFDNIQKGRSSDTCAPPKLGYTKRDLWFSCRYDNAGHSQRVCRLDRVEEGESKGISDVNHDYDGETCTFCLPLTRLEDGTTRYEVVVATENNYTSDPVKTIQGWSFQKVRKMNNTSPTLEMTQSETGHFTVKCEMFNTWLLLDCGTRLSQEGENLVSMSFPLEDPAKTQTCHCQASTANMIFLPRSPNNSQIIIGTFKPISVSCCNATTYGENCDQTCTCVAENTADCHNVDGTCTCKPGFTGSNCESESNCLQNQFKCHDGHCIYGSYRCDDAPDCSDASDELNCQTTTTQSISSTMESTDVDTGVTNSKVCINSSTCGIHTCKATGSSFTCVCKDGYVNTSPQHCEDVNECLDPGKNSSLCGDGNHTCVNTNGSYSCRCQEGYENVHPKLCTEVLHMIKAHADSGRSNFAFSNIEVLIAEIFLSLIFVLFLAFNLGLLTKTIIDAVYLGVTTESVDTFDELEDMDDVDDTSSSFFSSTSTYYREEDENYSPTLPTRANSRKSSYSSSSSSSSFSTSL